MKHSDPTDKEREALSSSNAFEKENVEMLPHYTKRQTIY